MSFQHFRLGDMGMPSHIMQHKGTTSNINGAPPDSANQFTIPPQNHATSFPANQSINGHTAASPGPSSTTITKQPYGSGDAEDGYTLKFSNIAEFNAWRAHEEETQMVEFVKGDTHGSKAVPPRFKEHTKLVCARHSRSGRKKYVKKHPDRVRKVPSRKLDGQGCPASISYKTYFETPEVRACYVSQHSHEIGPANLPFTRRGRKVAAIEEKGRTRKQYRSNDASEDMSPTPMPAQLPVQVPVPVQSPQPIQQLQPQPQAHPQPQQQPQVQPQQQPQPQQQQQQLQQQLQSQQQIQPQPQPIPQPQAHHIAPAPTPQPIIQHPSKAYAASVSALAPLPAQTAYQPQPQPPPNYHPQTQQYQAATIPHPHIDPNATRQDRWDNMSTLFASVREHARNFAYPTVSVAALEAILIRLYLESPVGGPATHPNANQQQHMQQQAQVSTNGVMNENAP